MAEQEISPKQNKTTLVMFMVIVILAFAVGVMWQKINFLQNQGSAYKTQIPSPTVNPNVQSANINQIKDLFNKDVIAFGGADRKVIFVEASDPSCPFCHIAAGLNSELNNQDPRFKLVADGGDYVAPVSEMKKLLDSGDAAYIFLYQNGHGAGRLATQALYCANEQNSFWEARNTLYTDAGYTLINDVVKNNIDKIDELVKFLSLVVNSSDLTECLESGRYDSVLDENVAISTSLGLTGTPGFYINDKKFSGAYNYTQMKPVVDSFLD